ncbi:MAG: hypothetical protein JST58_17035 [Bacteroidetes bacterium]|nr:hypothetical protein [Bacteroidota bacterium]
MEISLFLCLWGQTLSAQEYDYTKLYFKHYLAKDGLRSANCYKLYKDSYGFIWISTYYGISIFEGNQFINLPICPKGKNYCFTSSPHSFFQLNKTQMLIGSSDGLFIFNYGTMEIDRLPDPPDISKDYKITILGMDAERKTLFLKCGNALIQLDSSFKQISTLKCEDESEGTEIINIGTFPQYFYYTKSSHIISVNIETGRKDTLLHLPGAKDEMVINAESPTKYCIASNMGIYNLDIKSEKQINKTDFPNKAFLPFCVKMDGLGNYWVGGKEALYYYISSSNKLIFTKGKSSVENDPLEGIITDIILDKDDLFMSMSNNGILKYEHQSSPFVDFYSQDPQIRDINAMTVQGNHLIIAKRNDGAEIFNINDSPNQRPEEPKKIKSENIIYVSPLEGNNIWLGFEKDFRLAIAKTNPFEIIQPGGFPTDSIAKSFFAKHSRFWRIDQYPIIQKISDNFFYYSIHNLLFSIQGSVAKGFSFSFIDSIPSSSFISSINQSADGILLIGSSNLEIFVLEDKKLVKKYAPNAFLNIPIKSICQDTSSHETFVVTVNGVFIFDNHFHLIDHLSKETKQMKTDIFYAGVLDKWGILWLSNPVGITAYDSKRKLIYDFPSNLFHDCDFSTRCVAEDSIGNIYFGGSTGITGIHINDFSGKNGTSYLYISAIKNTDSTLYQGILPNNILSNQNFEYDQNSFQFDLNTICSHQIAVVSFKYMLEGYDKTWQYAYGRKVCNYENLAPGSYRFRALRVTGDDAHGDGITYTFKISKPFWKTWLFMVGSILFGISLIVIVIRYFMDKGFEQQRIKTAKELALKSERERIALELHDNLGSGLTSIRLLSKSIVAKPYQEKTTPKLLGNIEKISGELIDQMSEIIWLMNHMDDTINGLIAYTRNYLADYIQRANLPLQMHFENNIKSDCYINGITQRNLLLVLKEAFHNVVKHSNATSFTISFNETDSLIKVSIWDNGIGIPKDISPNGNGINNMTKRITSINGKIDFKVDGGTHINIQIPK